MPRIDITKMDKHICEHCGKRIGDSVHCEITTATNRVIKMHRECAVDFAVEILIEAKKDKELLNSVMCKYQKELDEIREGEIE